MAKKTDKGKNSRKGQMKEGKPDPLFGEENPYLQLLEMAPDAFFQGSSQGELLFVNKSGLALTGYSREELMKMSIRDMFPEAVLEEKPLRFDLLKEGKVVKAERTLRTKSGKLIPVEMHSQMMPDGTFQTFVRDLSERKRAEEAFRNLVEKAGIAILIDDEDGKFTYFNRKFIELFGYSACEIRTKSIREMVHPDDVDRVMSFHQKRLNGEDIPSRYDFRGIRKDGSTVYLEVDAVLMRENGNINGTRSYLWDISDRKRAEEALRASEKKYRDLFEKSEDAILIIENRTFVNCNEATARMLRYKDREELLNTHPSELSPEFQPDGRRSYEKADEMMRIALDRGSHRFEWNHKRADGEVFPVEVLLTAISADDNKQILHTVWRDITDRKQAEDKLQHAKEYAENLIHTANVIFVQLNNKGEVIKLNEAAEQITGYTQAEVQGKNWFETLVPKDCYPQVWEMFSHITKSGHVPRAFENPILTKYGHERYIVWQNSVLKENDDIVGTISFGMDITDRKQAELALRKSEEKFRTLIDQATDSMFLSDLNGDIVEVNQQACLSRGYTRNELLEKNVRDLDPEFEEMDHVNTIWEKLIPGKTVAFESTHRRKDGSTFPVEVNTGKVEIDGKPVILGVVRDITDRKQAEEKLFQAQKMDSIGDLAGGVAHDFNNMLGGIMGYASLLLMKETDPQKKNSIEAIIRAAERASELTQKLLAFGRKGKHLVQPVALNETIHEVHGLLKRSVDKRIEFVENLDGKLFTVDGDPSQMHQVIMNLCVNASQAMREGGVLTTSTRNVILDGTTGYKWADLAPGDYVEMIVTDTGIGMEEEVRRRAFDPFFSTKEDGAVKGTGLGLATVYGIVKNHGGAVEITSEVGMGTSVRVLLPRGKKPMVTKAADTETTEPGRGRILVVDDEDIVREMAKDMLESLGYEVLTAQDGLEGVRLYEEQHKEINGVILDLKMPKIDGKEAFVRMKQIDPDIRALLSTGYGLNEEVQSVLDEGAVDLVSKPYRLQELSDSMKKLLS